MVFLVNFSFSIPVILYRYLKKYLHTRVSTCCKAEIEKVAVFPVPDCALKRKKEIHLLFTTLEGIILIKVKCNTKFVTYQF